MLRSHIEEQPQTEGRWRLEREIARGGMGVVEHVFDQRLLRHVARKRVRPDKAHMSGQLRFEARILSRLQHPNIVTLHDMGWGDNGLPYFTMELIEGPTLQDSFENEELFSNIEELLNLLDPIFDVLEYAHAHGVIHRDIKPENLMFDQHNNLHVMDWGIAMIYDKDLFGYEYIDEDEYIKDWTANIRAGTPEFMSPEQVRGENFTLDPQVDVYAMGVLIYHLCTGRFPFQENSVDQTFERILTQPLRPMNSPYMTIPREFRNVVHRALSRDRSARYATIEELRDALDTTPHTTQSQPTLHRYRADDIIINKGDTAHEAFLLVDGHCEVLASIDDAWVQVGELSSGDFFGESVLTTDPTRNATVIATSDCSVYVIPEDRIHNFRRDIPPWAQSMLTSLITRGHRAEHRFRKLLAGPKLNDLIRQLGMWLTTYGIQGNNAMRGSWTQCASDIGTILQLSEGELYSALGSHPNIVIEAAQDRITMHHVQEVMGSV